MKRWDDIERQLNGISGRLAALGGRSATSAPAADGPASDIVICADPRRPPFVLRYFMRLMSAAFPTFALSHSHSSLPGRLPDSLADFLRVVGNHRQRSRCRYSVRLIWKPQHRRHPSLVVDPSRPPIVGEVNVARYFCRLLQGRGVAYTSLPAATMSKVDEVLDAAHEILSRDGEPTFGHLFSGRGAESRPLVGDDVTLADACLLSVCGSLPASYKDLCLKREPLLAAVSQR